VIAVTPAVLRAPRDPARRTNASERNTTIADHRFAGSDCCEKTDVEERNLRQPAAAKSAKRTPTCATAGATNCTFPPRILPSQTAASNNQTAMVASVLDVKDKVSPAVQPAAPNHRQ
jgi:hypothetical protein